MNNIQNYTMRANNLNFKDTNTHKKIPIKREESILYSKKGYSDLLRITHFLEGSLIVFTIGEIISKFTLIKNKNNLDKDALKKLGKKHTARLAGISLLSGLGTALFGMYYTNKIMLPYAEKKYDKYYESIDSM